MIPLALGLLTALACPQPSQVCVSAMDDSAANLSFVLGRGKGCAEPLPTQELIVRKAADKSILWRFSCKDTTLSQVRYGEVPDGCTGETAGPPTAGEALTVDVEATSGADGWLEITPR